MLRAVIFDLDDTLIDWSHVDDGTWEAAVLTHVAHVYEHIRATHPLESADAYVDSFKQCARRAWTDANATLVAPHIGRVLVEAAVALGVPPDCVDAPSCLAAYRWGGIEGSRLFPETVAVLSDLRDAGLRLGLITNAFEPMWMRDAELEMLGLAEHFPSCRFSAADFGYLKPHPSIFEAALQCMDVAGDEAVFVGDNLEADVAGAQKAGILGVLRRTHRTRNGDYRGVRPDRVIDSLDELPALFDDLHPGWRR